MGFLTNSSSNGTSPTADCCNSIKTLTSGSKDCFCLVVTGNVPFTLPINRTLAVSLPRACNLPGVPLQCKSTLSSILTLSFLMFFIIICYFKSNLFLNEANITCAVLCSLRFTTSCSR
jgi:hypothetical protein